MRRPGRARSPRSKRQDLAAVIGARIAQHRLERGWLQTELGARSGLRAQRLSRLENGHNVPNVHELVRLREALGMSIDELVMGKPAKPAGLLELAKRLQTIATAEQLREVERLLEVWILRIRSEKGKPA